MLRRCSLLIALVACGGRTGSDDSVATSTDGGAADDAMACDAAVAALDNVTTDHYCTSFLRVSMVDHAIRGGNVVCGPLKIASEADAREVLAPHIGPGTDSSRYVRVEPTGATYDFVFTLHMGDPGGMAVVSRATSKLVLSDEMVWLGPTSILFPTSFVGGSSSAAACAPVVMPDVHDVPFFDGPLDAAEVARAVEVAGRSALVRAVSRSHALVHTYVLPLYFGIGSAGDTRDKNEWIVVFDSIQLE